MYRTAIVVWLVILVVALVVVTSVTRIIEQFRPSSRVRKIQEKRFSVTQNSGFSTLKHQQSQPPQRR
jgi:hypothetical protein